MIENTVERPIKPCPFCGYVGINVHEASTFRWVVAECNYCGAQCGEVRRDTIKPSTKEEGEALALTEWNTRNNLTTEQPTQPPDVLSTASVCRGLRDDEIAKLVKDVTEIAREYHAHGSLRQRISNSMLATLKP